MKQPITALPMLTTGPLRGDFDSRITFENMEWLAPDEKMCRQMAVRLERPGRGDVTELPFIAGPPRSGKSTFDADLMRALGWSS